MRQLGLKMKGFSLLGTNEIGAIKQAHQRSCRIRKETDIEKTNSKVRMMFPEKYLSSYIACTDTDNTVTNVQQLARQAFLSFSSRILNLKVIWQVNTTAGDLKGATVSGKNLEDSTHRITGRRRYHF